MRDTDRRAGISSMTISSAVLEKDFLHPLRVTFSFAEIRTARSLAWGRECRQRIPPPVRLDAQLAKVVFEQFAHTAR